MMSSSSLLFALSIAPQLEQPADQRVDRLRWNEVHSLSIHSHDTLPDLLGPARAFECLPDFDGRLNFWVDSAMDCSLALQIEAESKTVRDDGAGGRRTPCAYVDVRAGQPLRVVVESRSESGCTKFELHVLAAPETAATLEAARLAQEELDSAERSVQGGDLTSVRTRLEEAIATIQAVPDAGRSPSLIGLCWRLAQEAQTSGALEVARSGWAWTLENAALWYPADHPELQGAKLGLGSTLYQMGELEEAERLLAKTVEIWSRYMPEEDSNLLRAHADLAVTIAVRGDLNRARELQEHVLAVQSRVLDPDDLSLQLSRANLAGTLKALGELERSRVLEETMLEVVARTLAADHPILQGARLNLASTIMQLGDLAAARELHEQALEVYTRTLPEDHPNRLIAEGNMALVLKEIGDLAGARALNEHVLAVRSRLLPDDHPHLLAARHQMAGTLEKLGDYAAARAHVEAVFAIRSQSLGPNHPDLQHTRLALAYLHAVSGDLEEAQRLETLALEGFSQTLPQDHPDLQSARLNLAATLEDLGQLDRALKLKEQALESLTRSLPEDHHELLWARHNLAGTLLRKGDTERARDLAVSLLESVGDIDVLFEESPRVAREAARRQLAYLDSAISLSGGPEASADLAAEFFAALETLRDVSISGPRIAAVRADSQDLTRSHREILNLRGNLNALVTTGPESAEDVDAWRAEVVRVATRRDQLERELRKQMIGQGLEVPDVNASSVSAALSPGTLALSFYRYGTRVLVDSKHERRTVQEDRLVAFLVEPEGEVTCLDLGRASVVEELVGRWRSSIGAPLQSSGESEVRPTEHRRIGSELRARVLDPLLKGREGVRQLVVLPDDSLHLVPLEALPAPAETGGGVLGDTLRIHYQVSFGQLIAQRPSSPSGRLLIAGDPDFDSEPKAEGTESYALASLPSPPLERGGQPGSFLPLRHTLQEVQDIAAVYEQAIGDSVLMFTGRRAEKATLLANAPRAGWLHVATHGWFAPEALPSRSESARSPQQARTLTRAEETVRGFAPETLCGLALAGANRGRDTVGRVPGVLTAEELAAFDLSQCELAVLSACETNVGVRRAGQGIQSLQAALHAAGARTVITSLWRVDDNATMQLMQRFYSYLWLDGWSKAEALWRAKSDLRALRKPTRDWAGWVLTGATD